MVDISDDSWNPHNLSAQETLRKLDSSPEGLSEEEAEKRLEKYGPNRLRREEGRSPLEMFLSEFKSPLVLLLLGAFALTVAIHEFTDATVIGVIIVLNSGIGFVQEYRAEKTLEALRGMLEPTTTVVRDGEKRTISAEKLVPGDIISLEPGQRVPADARLIEALRLQTQESPLTGESTPVSKQVEGTLPVDTPIADRMNMILMGTTVVKGTGKAVVTHTGMESEFGGVSQEVQLIEKEETPLMRRLMSFSKKLSIAALILMAAAVSVELYQTGDLVLALMTAVALSLSAVPEGLPAVITIMLSLGMKNMAEKNAIVRRLSSVEGLGSTTVICADKTGTITEDQMTARKVYVDGKDLSVSGKGYKPEGEFTFNKGNPQEVVTQYAVEDIEKETPLRSMLRIFALCNNTSLNYDTEEEAWKVIGDPTEGALIILAQKGGVVKEEVLEQYPVIQENPFTPSRKMMSTIHQTPDGDKVAYIKGAPETVLERSTHIHEDGEVKKLTTEKREETLEKVESMTEGALRVIAAAYKNVEDEEYTKEEAVERNMVFVGIAGMQDPPRESVKESIALCRTAGIEVKMITGDHLKTAMAVAEEVGLIERKNIENALTGQEVSKMSDEELQEAVKRVKVFARVSPENKRRIASALQANGEIVAMTGDGVNDAPAVKKADTGVSMGK
ncbi:MAG: cation-translocating P-type ATPase, partial [Candidatus Bathyarchaeia archaeon]